MTDGKATDDQAGRGGASLMEKLVEAGHWTEAEAAARAIPFGDGPNGDDTHVRALIALGAGLLKAGDREKGASILAEAESLVPRLRGGRNWEDAYALLDLGEAWRDGGDTAQAMRLWDASVKVVEGTDTARLLTALFRESRSKGLWKRAHRVLALLPRRYASR
jgi:hypothetical protein